MRSPRARTATRWRSAISIPAVPMSMSRARSTRPRISWTAWLRSGFATCGGIAIRTGGSSPGTAIAATAFASTTRSCRRSSPHRAGTIRYSHEERPVGLVGSFGAVARSAGANAASPHPNARPLRGRGRSSIGAITPSPAKRGRVGEGASPRKEHQGARRHEIRAALLQHRPLHRSGARDRTAAGRRGRGLRIRLDGGTHRHPAWLPVGLSVHDRRPLAGRRGRFRAARSADLDGLCRRGHDAHQAGHRHPDPAAAQSGHRAPSRSPRSITCRTAASCSASASAG